MAVEETTRQFVVGVRAIELLREIVRLHAEGDFEAMSEVIERAGRWLAEDESEPVADEGEGDQARDESVPEQSTAAPAGRGGVDSQAFVALYNAAKRLIDQGPTPSTMAELARAVESARRFV